MTCAGLITAMNRVPFGVRSVDGQSCQSDRTRPFDLWREGAALGVEISPFRLPGQAFVFLVGEECLDVGERQVAPRSAEEVHRDLVGGLAALVDGRSRCTGKSRVEIASHERTVAQALDHWVRDS
jgi:hypothetical protein